MAKQRLNSTMLSVLFTGCICHKKYLFVFILMSFAALGVPKNYKQLG